MPSKLDLADAQFIGYYHGSQERGIGLMNMVVAMGLKKSEWLKLKEKYSTKSYLRESEVKEIDEHFDALDSIKRTQKKGSW